MNDKHKIRVLIIDDHAILRMGLTSLLETTGDIDVVGDASNGEAGLRKAVRLKPDVILLDLMMPGIDGVETMRRLRASIPAVHVLVLTTFGTADGISHALEAGALGAVMKNVEFPELVAAIRRTARGERVLSDEISRILKIDPPLPPLSPRQREILAALVQGLTNADIASKLDISFEMVKEHIKALFAKLGVANRAEAVAIALRKHIL